MDRGFFALILSQSYRFDELIFSRMYECKYGFTRILRASN
jgi:hypothetical protein